MGAKEMPGPSGAAPPGVFTGAPSVLPSGAASLEPGNKVPAGGDAKAQPEVTTTGKAAVNSCAAPLPSLAGRTPNTERVTKATTQPDGDKPTDSKAGSVSAGNQRPHEHQLQAKEAPVVEVAKVTPTTRTKTPDMPVGAIMAWHCALTSLSVTASVVVYDYVMNENPERSEQAALTVVSYGAGDLLGRLGYQTMLSTGEHRKVMALQAFLQGGLLFLMALSKEAVLLAPASFGLGWMSSTLDMLSLPVLQHFLEPDNVEHQLSTCRVASGVACLFGPLLITLFRDDGPQSYGVIFVVSGGLSLLAGALWLPGVKNDRDEARAKVAPVVATDKTAQVSKGVQHRPSSVWAHRQLKLLAAGLYLTRLCCRSGPDGPGDLTDAPFDEPSDSMISRLCPPVPPF
ncbi:uncharacterized protein LOC142774310 [Rhipicephalus microplus]|uniref:uncharacterized protein LOC142774310 n=1 Tax=Rhipicephalus microplus TaxID=6941 RepID=UPI003F6B1F14